MEEKYRPTKGEVWGEVWNGIKSKFTKEKFSRTGKALKDFSEEWYEGTKGMVILPYVVPSVRRSVREYKRDVKFPLWTVKDTGVAAGFVTGFVADMGQIIGYGYVVSKGHPEVLLIPVVTNVASGVYETGRSLYRDAKQKVLDRHDAEGLEAILQTEKSVRIRNSMETLLEESSGEYDLNMLIEEVRCYATKMGIGIFDRGELRDVFQELLDADQVYINNGKCYHVEKDS